MKGYKEYDFCSLFFIESTEMHPQPFLFFFIIFFILRQAGLKRMTLLPQHSQLLGLQLCAAAPGKNKCFGFFIVVVFKTTKNMGTKGKKSLPLFWLLPLERCRTLLITNLLEKYPNSESKKEKSTQ